MKKPYPHNVVSNCHCSVCHKPLKRNLIERKPDAEFCFKCYPKGKKNRAGAHKVGEGYTVKGTGENVNLRKMKNVS